MPIISSNYGNVLQNRPLHDVMQEALTKHIQGQKFREWNAGWNLDQNMDNEGFNNGIGIDLSTGFVFGGNPHNCGTCMDKMGSSEKACTKDEPATPRDGSAIELVALRKTTVAWLKDMNEKKAYPYSGVTWKNTSKAFPPCVLQWLILSISVLVFLSYYFLVRLIFREAGQDDKFR